MLRFFVCFIILLVLASGWTLLYLGFDDDSMKRMAYGIVLIFAGLAMEFAYLALLRGGWIA